MYQKNVDCRNDLQCRKLIKEDCDMSTLFLADCRRIRDPDARSPDAECFRLHDLGGENNASPINSAKHHECTEGFCSRLEIQGEIYQVTK